MSLKHNASEVVLDPFMGSGTSAIAALRTERSYVGYEMDKKYAKLAEKRIASSTTQAT
ncbi:MAG: hypothetical protein KJZ53_07500 [Anaerolineales bacterium]|nr:hypothetical protein [Anaerolineales bacterium]